MNIKAYINAKKNLWSASTLKSETARLYKVSHLIPLPPQQIWDGLQSQSAYTRITTWTRIASYREWDSELSAEPLHTFRKANPQLFRNAYTRKLPCLSFEEAGRCLRRIKNIPIREQAMLILHGGLRYSESLTLQDGHVKGKGGKLRRVALPKDARPMYKGSYTDFYRALKSVGLKPHDLRKLGAQRLVAEGANVFQLKELMGWSSLETAESYIGANGIEDFIKEVV